MSCEKYVLVNLTARFTSGLVLNSSERDMITSLRPMGLLMDPKRGKKNWFGEKSREREGLIENLCLMWFMSSYMIINEVLMS